MSEYYTTPVNGTDLYFYPLHFFAPSIDALLHLSLANVVHRLLGGLRVGPGTWWLTLAGGIHPSRSVNWWDTSYSQGGFT